jgi:hypothetical protein
MYDIIFINDQSVESEKKLKNLRERFPLTKAVTKTDKIDYSLVFKKSLTKIFWLIDLEYNSEINPDFDFDYEIPKWDQSYVHVFKQGKGYGGVYLMPKDYPITTKEAEYNFFIKTKNININASTYTKFDQFRISTYEDYLEAKSKTKTSMFYAIMEDVVVDPKFDFDFPVSKWDKDYVHVFKQGKRYGGVYLMPKDYPITTKEAEYNFFIKNKKVEMDISSVSFDIVFISYQEPNADENYKKLVKRFPRAKRIHGITGIHQAHKAAAELVGTSMFWVVDGDSVISNEFNFDYFVEPWDRKQVYVWQSINPVNGLIYGYGGVKLLPKQMVLDMDVSSVDMTTSISKDFVYVTDIASSTVYDTDALSTWRSAFRECVKLTKTDDSESLDRLNIWCTVARGEYAEYSLKGANQGKEFGTKYRDDSDMLRKINDWEWLEQRFSCS